MNLRAPTPKAFVNASPGFPTLGDKGHLPLNTIGVGERWPMANSFRVQHASIDLNPRVGNTTTPRGLPARGPRPGLELANAFGVHNHRPDSLRYLQQRRIKM